MAFLKEPLAKLRFPAEVNDKGANINPSGQKLKEQWPLPRNPLPLHHYSGIDTVLGSRISERGKITMPRSGLPRGGTF